VLPQVRDIRPNFPRTTGTPGGGARVAVTWSLEIRSVPLRLAACAAYPVMRWGHDRVVDMAVSGFRRRALPAAAAIATPGSDGRQVPRPL